MRAAEIYRLQIFGGRSLRLHLPPISRLGARKADMMAMGTVASGFHDADNAYRK